MEHLQRCLKTTLRFRSVTDCEKLQQTLDKLDIWTQDNITFNASKCKVLSVTSKKDPITYPYHLSQNDLSRVENEKDLGVTISYKLHWETRVNEIMSKANKQLGVLKRTCLSLTNVTQHKFGLQIITVNSTEELKEFKGERQNGS
jgi:hypothetical protein